MFRFYEFFAGAGLATLGLGSRWECVWANDFDPKKASVYRANFGDSHFHLGDVASIVANQMPNKVDMAWASFPCQDLSLAGWQRGLSAGRSGTFWPFWKLMQAMSQGGERPPLIVLENVVGMLHGDTFEGLCEALAALGMQFGALVMDAREFLPQSRPRVFIVAVDIGVDVSQLSGSTGVAAWTPRALVKAHASLPSGLKRLWRWWQVPVPSKAHGDVKAVIEDTPTGVAWNSATETNRLLGMMNQVHIAKIEEALATGKEEIGFVYKRIRNGEQRAEVRFDGVAGCLRTPKGGSSRQTVVIVEAGKVRSRLLSPREAARLMGVPDSFKLPSSYNDAYKAMGDAVAVPVVSWLSDHLIEPLAHLATANTKGRRTARSRTLSASAERKAEGWTKEHKGMATVELTEACIAALKGWHREQDEQKASALDAFIACAGIKVAELSRTKWPIERTDIVGDGGRFRSTGQFIKKVLQRFGEERMYASEGGRTTGGSIEAATRLAHRLNEVPGYTEATAAERAAIAHDMQDWLYTNVVKPYLDSEGLKVEIDAHKPPPAIISDILRAARVQGVSGAVAQHLVGAKLAMRFPLLTIENYGHTTQDRQLGRKGDFELNDHIIHVTMTPQEQVVDKCSQNVRDGYRPMLLVPEAEVPVAEALVKRSKAADKIWVQSLESFIGQNVAEIAEFGSASFRDQLRLLIQKYNVRVGEVETRKALTIKAPDNL